MFSGKRKTGETVCAELLLMALPDLFSWAICLPYLQISISSSVVKNSVPYKLHVVYKSPTGKVLQDKRFEAPFTMWFSKDGVFHPEPFRRWLASEVDVLRLAAKENEKKTGGVAAVVPPPGESSKRSG